MRKDKFIPQVEFERADRKKLSDRYREYNLKFKALRDRSESRKKADRIGGTN